MAQSGKKASHGFHSRVASTNTSGARATYGIPAPNHSVNAILRAKLGRAIPYDPLSEALPSRCRRRPVDRSHAAKRLSSIPCRFLQFGIRSSGSSLTFAAVGRRRIPPANCGPTGVKCQNGTTSAIARAPMTSQTPTSTSANAGAGIWRFPPHQWPISTVVSQTWSRANSRVTVMSFS